MKKYTELILGVPKWRRLIDAERMTIMIVLAENVEKNQFSFTGIICSFRYNIYERTVRERANKRKAKEWKRNRTKPFLIHSSRYAIRAKKKKKLRLNEWMCVFVSFREQQWNYCRKTEYRRQTGLYRWCAISWAIFFFALLLHVLTSPLKMLNYVCCNWIACWMSEINWTIDDVLSKEDVWLMSRQAIFVQYA